MNKELRNPYKELPLDPDQLSRPFKVQTNWHVITGAPCSGKTTLIELLGQKGFKTFPEAARQYFDRELAKGRTIDEIRADPAGFTLEILDLWIELKRGLDPADLIFLDRGFPDGCGFLRTAGLNPNDIIPECLQYHYASVFMLERLPYQFDGVRAGDDVLSAYYETWTLRDFSACGYQVIQVPVLPPEERLAFILERVLEYQPVSPPRKDPES